MGIHPSSRILYLLLHIGELLKVTLQKGHLLLLSFVVACSKDIVVVLAGLIQRHFKFNHTLTAALKITHQCLLHDFKVGKLLSHRFTHTLKILFFLAKVTTGGRCRCSLIGQCSLIKKNHQHQFMLVSFSSDSLPGVARWQP